MFKLSYDYYDNYFYKLRKLNTYSTKKEVKEKCYVLDKNILNTFFKCFMFEFLKIYHNFEVVFFDMLKPVIFESLTFKLMKSFLMKA